MTGNGRRSDTIWRPAKTGAFGSCALTIIMWASACTSAPKWVRTSEQIPPREMDAVVTAVGSDAEILSRLADADPEAGAHIKRLDGPGIRWMLPRHSVYLVMYPDVRTMLQRARQVVVVVDERGRAKRIEGKSEIAEFLSSRRGDGDMVETAAIRTMAFLEMSQFRLVQEVPAELGIVDNTDADEQVSRMTERAIGSRAVMSARPIPGGDRSVVHLH